MNSNHEVPKPSNAICIYVDVDGTLIRHQGTNTQTNGELVLQAKKWKKEGALLYCWSSRGGEYAQRVARRLGIEDCFIGFLWKPHVLVDDQAINDWACLVHIYPPQACNYSVEKLNQLIEDDRSN